MDGDTDVPSVQQDFAAALYQLMRRASRKEEDPNYPATKHPNETRVSNEYQNEGTIPNGVAKQITNGESNYVGIDATTNINGITTRGNLLLFNDKRTSTCNI